MFDYVGIARHRSTTGRYKEDYQDRHAMPKNNVDCPVENWHRSGIAEIGIVCPHSWFQRLKHGSSLSYIDKA